jgi:hypothetical protein
MILNYSLKENNNFDKITESELNSTKANKYPSSEASYYIKAKSVRDAAHSISPKT